jgi:hypothetical protein
MIGVAVVLLSLGFLAQPLHAQQGRSSDVQRRSGGLLQNFPNPFNPETTLPFELAPELFESGRPVRVTMQIFNTMHQLVAIPTALDHPEGNRPEMRNLLYMTPGEHRAFWDGLDMNGRKVASAQYIVQLEVNGRRLGTLMKILVAK